jgi:hypothetical protein
MYNSFWSEDGYYKDDDDDDDVDVDDDDDDANEDEDRVWVGYYAFLLRQSIKLAAVRTASYPPR